MNKSRLGSLTLAALTATSLTFSAVSPAAAQSSFENFSSSTGSSSSSKTATSASGASITISENNLPAEGEHEITVTGRGFKDPSATPTRPPLAGQNGGVYVTASTFAQDWRPSTGAPSSNRPSNRDNLKWFVATEETFNLIGGEAAGAGLLDEDGNFTFIATVSKEAADASALEDGSYGVYLYPGGGANVPEWELFLPITFTESGDPVPNDPDLTLFGTLLAVGGVVAALVGLFNAALANGLINPNILPAQIRSALNI